MKYLVSVLSFFFVLSAWAFESPRRAEFVYAQGTYSDNSVAKENALRLRSPLNSHIDVGLDFAEKKVFGEQGYLAAPFASVTLGDRWVFQGGGIVSNSSPVYPVSQVYAEAGYKWLESRQILTYFGGGRTHYVSSAHENFILAEVVWYSPWGLILQTGARLVNSEPVSETYGRYSAVATYQALKWSASLRHDRGREAYEIVGVGVARFNFESSITSLQLRFALPDQMIGMAGYEKYQSEGLDRDGFNLGLGIGF